MLGINIWFLNFMGNIVGYMAIEWMDTFYYVVYFKYKDKYNITLHVGTFMLNLILRVHLLC